MKAWVPTLLLLLPLAACGGGGRGCSATLANASGQPIEQVYLARAGEAWGRDLVAPGEVPPGGTLPLRFAVEGSHAVRVVWANGRAAELQGVEACRMARITVRDAELQAE